MPTSEKIAAAAAIALGTMLAVLLINSPVIAAFAAGSGLTTAVLSLLVD